jgi:hypothetical protein
MSDGSVQESNGTPVAEKLVLQLLKEKLGRARSKQTETQSPDIAWV